MSITVSMLVLLLLLCCVAVASLQFKFQEVLSLKQEKISKIFCFPAE